VDLREALTTDAGVNVVIQLEIGGEKQMSIVKDIQRHPVRRDVTHVDFLRIDPDQDVNVDVPLVMIGEAKAVTDADGMVDQNLFSLNVNAAPDSIPNELEVDISALTIGDSLRVADILLPEGVTTDVDPDETIAVGMITRSTLEAMAAEEAALAEAEGLELEGAIDGDSDEASADDTGDDADDA
jgi:large subunit ribosomal protein L25